MSISLCEQCEWIEKRERDAQNMMVLIMKKILHQLLQRVVNVNMRVMMNVKLHMKSNHDFVCGECDYHSKNKLDMRKHVETKHSIECENYSETFIGIDKLKSHMCTCKKSNLWYIRNNCIKIFSEKSQK